MNDKIRNDFQHLVDYCLSNAERLIERLSEFYPFGAQLEHNGEVTHIDAFDGDDFPLSSEVIKNLQTIFNQDSTSRLASAITYDVSAIDPRDEVKKDAIAIRINHLDMDEEHIYYFPYTKAGTSLEFSASWGEKSS